MHAGRIHRLDVDAGVADTIAESDTAPSGIGFLPDGRLLFASGSDLRVYCRTATGELTVHADLSELASWQLNDMIVDSHGRAYIGDYGDGSVPRDPVTPVGLLRVDPDGTASAAAGDMSFANGMVLTADRSTLIVAETRSMPGRLTAFDVASDGGLSGRRILCEFSTEVLPDGLAVDPDDNVWVASPFSGELLRVTGSGTVDRRVAVRSPYAVAYRAPDEGARLGRSAHG
ncbi:MAG TPA: SMP-30/gluconolactonase/LRE family protein [Candidatus Dietzia intestinigallinarum]|nr:SMP-30/gluconolactonase/LRE family protein [Candidatus Dietzia intestinigallinarum]